MWCLKPGALGAAPIRSAARARTALQGHSASPAARGTNKPVRPASCRKKRSATRLVGKFFLELRQRASAPHSFETVLGLAARRGPETYRDIVNHGASSPSGVRNHLLLIDHPESAG